MKIKPKLAMVFGVFDALHDGHRHFLAEAKKLAARLVIVVAPDSAVLALKGALPQNSLTRRIKNLEAEGVAARVVSGDEVPENWSVLSRYAPDIVALGYDQNALSAALARYARQSGKRLRIVTLAPYEDGALHSSVLRARDK